MSISSENPDNGQRRIQFHSNARHPNANGKGHLDDFFNILHSSASQDETTVFRQPQ